MGEGRQGRGRQPRCVLEVAERKHRQGTSDDTAGGKRIDLHGLERSARHQAIQETDNK